jgi:hypothetical protein
MIKVFHIIWTEAKFLIHRKSYLIFNFLLPFTVIAALIMLDKDGKKEPYPDQWDGIAKHYSIGLVNSRFFDLTEQTSMDNGENHITIIHFQEESKARRSLENGKIHDIYVFPEKASTPVTIRRICANTMDIPNLAKPLIRIWLVKRTALSGQLKNEILNPDVKTTVEYASLSLSTTEGRMLTSTFLFILVFLTLMTSGYLFQSFVIERNHHLLENLLGLIRPAEFIWGKMLGTLAAGSLPVIVWVPVLKIAAGDRLPPALQEVLSAQSSLVLLIPFLVLGILLFSAVLMLAVVLGSGPREGQQMATFLLISVIFVLQYLLVIRGGYPDFFIMRIIAILPPFTPPLAAALHVNHQISWIGYILYALLSLLYIFLFSWIVAKLLKATLYLKGSKGHFRKLLRLLISGRAE